MTQSSATTSLAGSKRSGGIQAGSERSVVDRCVTAFSWLLVAFSFAQILLFGFGRDQGIYATVAHAVLGGGMPYRDVWDFKPPGVFVVYALAEMLFGKTMVAPRLLECAGLLVLVLSFRRIGRLLFDSQAAGVLGGALTVFVHAQLEFWHTGQPESFGAVLLAVALSIAAGEGITGDVPRSRRAWSWVMVGVLFGAAFLLKPPLGGAVAPVALQLSYGEWRRKRSILAALGPIGLAALGSFLPIAACGAWFWARGAWPALSWTLFEFTPGYTRLGWGGSPVELLWYGTVEAFTGFSYLLPFGIGLALVLPGRAVREKEGFVVLGSVVAIHLVGIALQAKFFQYHFGSTLPVLMLLAGVGIHRGLVLSARKHTVLAVLLAGVVTVLVASRVALRHNPGTYWERSALRLQFLFTREPSREALDAALYHVAGCNLDVNRRVARVMERLSLPGDPVFVWGFEPVVYWFAGREPSSRFIYNVPQRATWQRDQARAELMASLRARPPAAIAVQHGDFFRFVTGDDLDSSEALPTFPELAAFVDGGYELVEAVGHMDVYRRR